MAAPDGIGAVGKAAVRQPPLIANAPPPCWAMYGFMSAAPRLARPSADIRRASLDSLYQKMYASAEGAGLVEVGEPRSITASVEIGAAILARAGQDG